MGASLSLPGVSANSRRPYRPVHTQVLRAQGCKAKVTVNATAGAHLEVAQTNPRFANLDAVLQARQS